MSGLQTEQPEFDVATGRGAGDAVTGSCGWVLMPPSGSRCPVLVYSRQLGDRRGAWWAVMQTGPGWWPEVVAGAGVAAVGVAAVGEVVGVAAAGLDISRGGFPVPGGGWEAGALVVILLPGLNSGSGPGQESGSRWEPGSGWALDREPGLEKGAGASTAAAGEFSRVPVTGR